MEERTIAAAAFTFTIALLTPLVALALLARLGGWATLAERYPGRPRPAKVARWFGYGVFRGWVGYNGGLVIGSDASGLDVRALPVVLSFCHAPIFIPWHDVARIEKRPRWFGTVYRLVMRRARDVNFALRPATFDVVRSDARAAGVAGDY